MLDFGSGVLFNLHKFLDINSLDAIYLSHYHADHIADVGALQYAVKVQTDLGIRKSSLPIYGLEDGDHFKTLSYHEYTEGRVVSAGEELNIGPFSCRFLANIHSGDALTLRIDCDGQSFVYTGDTGWNDELIDFASGCDLLLCECSLFNRFKGRVPGHLTTDEAGMIAEKSGAGELLLCHFPHFGTRDELKAEVEQSFSGKVELAMPGNVYNLTILK
jgi:ribonuclease BN (tRNA processing enzyme)